MGAAAAWKNLTPTLAWSLAASPKERGKDRNTEAVRLSSSSSSPPTKNPAGMNETGADKFETSPR